MKTTFRPRFLNAIVAVAGVFALGTVASLPIAWAQDADDYEWDPRYGYHEEEWYDPSDWLDPGEGVDYEREYFGSYYDDDRYGYGIGDDDYYEDEYYEEVYEDDEPGFGDYSEPWYGDNQYTNDWYNAESGFDTWYNSP